MISNIDTDMRKGWVTDATIYDRHLREQREDTKWAIIIHRSKKNRQHNGKKKKRTYSDLQDTTLVWVGDDKITICSEYKVHSLFFKICKSGL